MLAVVWHFWIAAVAIFPLVMFATVAMVVQYLRKTQGPKYPHIKE